MPPIPLPRCTLRSSALRLFPALALALGAGAGAPDLAAQAVRCDTPCVISGGASTAGTPGSVGPTSSARELLQRMAEAYQERMASVDDYLVVQSSYILTGQGTLPPDSGDGPPPTPPPAPAAGEGMAVGPPAVLYFEKQQVEGRSAFVGVPPSELAKRENQSMGGPELGELANVLGEAMKLLPEGLRSMVSEDDLTNAITGVNPEDREQDDVIDYLWSAETRAVMMERGRRVRVDTIGGRPMSVIYADDLRDLMTPEGFEIEAATLWLDFDDRGDPISHAFRVHGWLTTPAGPKPVSVERNWGDYRSVGPLYQPFRITDRLAGLTGPGGALTQVAKALDSGIYTVATVVKSVKYNTGPPTQAEMAKYVRDGWNRPGEQWKK